MLHLLLTVVQNYTGLLVGLALRSLPPPAPRSVAHPAEVTSTLLPACRLAGKSTLAALLAARLGISTVVSTDSIRHMMRRQV